MGVTVGAAGVGAGCVAAGEVAVAALGGVGDTGAPGWPHAANIPINTTNTIMRDMIGLLIDEIHPLCQR
jgi:hypothetical protein